MPYILPASTRDYDARENHLDKQLMATNTTRYRHTCADRMNAAHGLQLETR